MVHAPSAATEKISVDLTTKKADERVDEDKQPNNNVKNGDPANAGNMIVPPDQQLSRSPDILVDAPSPKIEDNVQAGVGLAQKQGVKGEDSKTIIDLSVTRPSAAVNELDNNSDEPKTNDEISYYSNHNHHHVNGVLEDEEKLDLKAEELETEEMDKGQYVGNGSWEEKTWKELVRLREDMFWARLGGFRG